MTESQEDLRWMDQALALARQGAEEGEVPVGAVVVQNGQAVGEGWNRPIAAHDPTAHAEIQAMRQAAADIGNYRLTGCTLYVTLEPCAMCVGAIIHARIGRLVYGATEPKTGAVESRFQLLHAEGHNHTLDVTGGVLAEESGEVLRRFFAERRERARLRKSTGSDRPD